MNKNIIITGIPGSGTTNFCRDFVEFSRLNGLSVGAYNIGETLLKLAQETPRKPPVLAENLLNLHPDFLEALRSRAFEITTLGINTEDKVRSIIDIHAQFFWNNIYTNAYDWHHLANIDADLFITLIEKPSTIREQLMMSDQGRSQDHDLRDLLLWQNIEVNVTSGWAANYQKPHYVLPGRQNPEIIESLLSSAFLIYFQMPMTDASSEADDQITDFKEQILDIGRQLTGLATPLIDPRTIDIETGDDISDKEEKAIRIQTVHRDMNWYIAQASDLIAFYPPSTILSKGVSDESTRGFETGKNAFVVYSGQYTSPFMDISTRVFKSAAEFFDFFPDYMLKRIRTLSRI